MGAEDAIFDAFQRLIAELERYPSLPPGGRASRSPPLQSASVHAGPGDREPTVEVMETDDHVYVTVELPGVSRETIDLQASPDALAVAATGATRYSVQVPLPAKVRTDSIRVTERNGVLDVALEKDVGDVRRAPGG